MNITIYPNRVVFYSVLFCFGFLLGCQESTTTTTIDRPPNFILLMSDNQNWEHLGCYGDPVVRTPVIDGIAKEGIRFENAFCSAPSCAPARASMLTGQDIWRLEEAANLWSSFPKDLTVFTDLLEEAGYLVGYEGKGWGPGDWEAGGRTKDPSGTKYYSFEEFFNERDKGQPFLYWFSSRDPHRPFKRNGWKKAGIDVDGIKVPPYLPDVRDVKEDIGDYYAEIEDFDRDVASYIQLLKEMGELDNTVIIICSDNGWQMPRGLANLYDYGTHIPLIVSMPKRFTGGRIIDDFVSLNDIAPTFLELAGVEIPSQMNARSFVNILESEEQGQIDKSRNFMVTARERHAWARKGGTGYGARAWRTKDFLYIRNYEPDFWPAGDPPLFGDVDPHMLQYPGLTKMYILKNRHEEGIDNLFELGFGKRPKEELYDLQEDPWQMTNVAQEEKYNQIREELSEKLTHYLLDTQDPRETGEKMQWLNAPYYAEKDFYPKPNEEAIEALNLKEEYSLVNDED